MKTIKSKGKGKSAAKVPATKIISKIDKKMRIAPPKAKPNSKETATKIPQRKTNKSMKGMQMLVKGMAKLGNGHA